MEVGEPVASDLQSLLQKKTIKTQAIFGEGDKPDKKVQQGKEKGETRKNDHNARQCPGRANRTFSRKTSLEVVKWDRARKVDQKEKRAHSAPF